ncbi:hypothetical protein EI555_012072 [Monodon monoceros]|uniref:Non-selective voltage-gated ion channel VDAC1 n=1 Tax=Monodon monoceros TaxID=40151 RepID=A0A4U1F4L7_MONMO|nr:hypothetical protein EI555_012072 [Monodon monoceros]
MADGGEGEDEIQFLRTGNPQYHAEFGLYSELVQSFLWGEEVWKQVTSLLFLWIMFGSGLPQLETVWYRGYQSSQPSSLSVLEKPPLHDGCLRSFFLESCYRHELIKCNLTYHGRVFLFKSYLEMQNSNNAPAVPAAEPTATASEQKMAVPPTYADLGKSARDVFTKSYAFGLIKLDLQTKSENGLEFTSSSSANTETTRVTGSLETKLQVDRIWSDVYGEMEH